MQVCTALCIDFDGVDATARTRDKNEHDRVQDGCKKRKKVK